MSRRMAGLMLCALALGLLLALDGPQSGPLVEASAGPERALRPESELVAGAVPAHAAHGGPGAHGVAQAEQAAQTAQGIQAAQGTRAAKEALAASAARLDDAVVDLFTGADGGASAAAPPPAADEEPRSSVPVTLLGFKEENGTRDAYLLHDGAVYMVRAGAVLLQRYRVLALHQDAVHLQDQQTGGKIRIAFGDKE